MPKARAYPVCSQAGIPPGKRKIVRLAGRSIGIFNLNGRFFALKNLCPHQGAQLCRGTLKGITTMDENGRPRLEREGEVIRCPWHGWEFDIATGRSLFNLEGLRVKTYSVSVEKGIVTVHI